MSEITRAAIGMPFSMAMESELSRRQFHSIAQALLAERDQLRAEVAGLRTGYEAYEQVNAELKAENEALRKDSARLDRLDQEREAYGTSFHEGNRWTLDGQFATVRDAIDAALGQGELS